LTKTIRSFNADSEINDLINESKVPKGELSIWINDKIRKGILYDTAIIEKDAPLLKNIRIKI
jgi:hypothetical protein